MKNTKVCFHAIGYWFQRCSKQSLFISIVLANLLFASGCKQQPSTKYQLVKAYGNGKIANATKSFIFYSNECSMVSPGAFMASEGDLLMIEDWAMPYSSNIYPVGQPIRFIASDSVLLINNKVVGLCLDTNYRMEKILANVDSASILDLQVLSISSSGVANYASQLNRIAAINPNINIQIVDSISTKDLTFLLSRFDPTCLFGNINQTQFGLLETEQKLANLFINLYDEPNLLDQPLPALKNLKILALNYTREKPVALSEIVLRNNPQIERLTLANFDSASVTGILQPLKQLKELIWTGGPIKADEIVAHSQTLERLLIDSIDMQIQLPHLRWASIANSESSSVLLDSLAQHLPNIEVMEIFGDGNKMNVTALQAFKHLTALTLVDADSIDLNPVKEMKQLELLSYSLDEGNEDSTIAVLRASLPKTLVVPNDGFCVGSGWLLLLLPAMLLSVIWATKTSRKNSTSLRQ